MMRCGAVWCGLMRVVLCGVARICKLCGHEDRNMWLYIVGTYHEICVIMSSRSVLWGCGARDFGHNGLTRCVSLHAGLCRWSLMYVGGALKWNSTCPGGAINRSSTHIGGGVYIIRSIKVEPVTLRCGATSILLDEWSHIQ